MPILRRVPVGLLTLALLGVPRSAAAGPADGWTRFRGPNGQGIARDHASYPQDLGAEGVRRWRQELCAGHSSPVVSQGRVFLTGADETQFHLIAFSFETGEESWRRSLPLSSDERLHPVNSAASSTPACDAERVVVAGPNSLFACDLDGTLLWERPVPAARNTFGRAASPVLHEGEVLFPRDAQEGSFLEVLDARTGEPRLHIDRSNFASGWSTPTLRPRPEGETERSRTEILVYGVWWLTAYGLEDGVEHWSVPGLADEPITTPLIEGDRVFVTSYNMRTSPEVIGLPTFEELLSRYDHDHGGTLDRDEAAENQSVLSRFDADGEGDHPLVGFFRFLDVDRDGAITAAEYEKLIAWVNGFEQANGVMAVEPGAPGEGARIAWQFGRGVPECPSPIVHEGKLYALKNGGLLTILDTASGEPLFEGRTALRGPIYSSPVLADGKLYLCSARGQVLVIAAEPTLRELSCTDLGERILATPALVDGTVLVRTERALHSFGS